MKLNLASGQRPFKEPWKNIDIRKQYDSKGNPYKLDVEANIKDLHMFPDESADILVAHHCLEHIDMSEVFSTAKEWYRVMKKGGKLAVFVPNMRALVDAWIAGKIDNYIFNVNVFGAYQGHLEDLHRWSYTERYLIDQMSGWDGNKNELDWKTRIITPDVLRESIYKDAEVSLDWWILAMEFEK